MTKTEFIEKSKANGSRQNRFTMVWVFVITVLTISASILKTTGWEVIRIPRQVLVPGVLACLFLQMVVFLWLSARFNREFGLVCHGCSKPLVGQRARFAVINSGSCLFCKVVVLETEKEASS
jgi:hypothetical protein